jgi:phosphoglycolate phosphatase-like HAD superfamily hydrolase
MAAVSQGMRQGLNDNPLQFLQSAGIVFWDFDGVIKDSVEVKSDAFERLFMNFGRSVSGQVRRHHEANGGMSRFDKMPIYLAWAGEPITPEKIHEYCSRFSENVQQAVIDAPWVPGVREYLLKNHTTQRFVLVTATPHKEMEYILAALALTHCFQEIHGAPAKKAEAIREVLARWQISASRALMVGDSDSDCNAAQANQVAFLLRCTPLNQSLQKRHAGPMFEELNYE